MAGVDVAVAPWARVGGSASAFAAVYHVSCVERGALRRTPVDPGLGLSGQATFTALWGGSS
jgi:hypothetical protein